MAKTCSICSHEYRKRIDELIALRKPLRDIAMTYGTTANTLVRHSKKCIARKVSLAVQNHDIAAGESFIGYMLSGIKHAEEILASNKGMGYEGDKLALQALRELRENATRLAEKTGELPRAGTTNIYMEFGGKDNAIKAAELWKETQDVSEEGLHASAMATLREYHARHPESKLADMAELAGQDG